jgi:NADPH-dependent 2,4-dienoyl-CoA reductase/sulfur reductase-like enzyme
MDVADAHANEDDFYQEKNIEVFLEKNAKSLDIHEKKVHLKDGEVGYGKLLYALGSEPRRLDIPGGENIWTLRTASDGVRIRESAQEGAKAVLIGGGYIGTEVAASLAPRGVDVTLIESQDRLHRYLPDGMAKAIREQLESMGIRILTGESVESVNGRTVKTTSGKEIEADMVIEGVGAVPRTQIAEEAGLTKGKTGLLADATLRSHNPHVWLSGDVVEYPDPIMEHPFRAEHHMHAQWTGLHAGKSMAGATDEFRKAPYFFSDIGQLSFILRGDPEAEGRTFDVGSADGPRLTRFVIRDDGRLASFNDLRKDWGEQEPLVDLAERIIEHNVSVEPLVPSMGSADFDPARLGELLV